MNITTGIIANKEINLYEAVQIGKKIHQDLDSTKFIDIKFVKAKQTKTSMTMRKSVRVDKDDNCYSVLCRQFVSLVLLKIQFSPMNWYQLLQPCFMMTALRERTKSHC